MQESQLLYLESKTETTGDKPKAPIQAKETDEDVTNIRKLAGIN